MRAFREEYKPKKAIIVSMDRRSRDVNGITIMPWKTFLGDLWAGSIIA
ncbi:MAG: hypothetical protein HYV34_02440 [Candidatus Kerfeldbacteria bacterium]|nr:hypothetical protein [Candidatus Kerfeldbacteria bacterium]